MISRGENDRPLATMAAGRMASAIELMPQMPQPVGPAMCRRRSLIASALTGGSHIRSSMPSSSSTMSSELMSSGDCTMPSLRLKPTAKSRKFCGVPIITA